MCAVPQVPACLQSRHGRLFRFLPAGLVAAAIDVRTRARAAFSHFQVGAALETDTGVVITGCNVENATYGLTICALKIATRSAQIVRP